MLRDLDTLSNVLQLVPLADKDGYKADLAVIDDGVARWIAGASRGG
jgi:hypothetical protein